MRPLVAADGTCSPTAAGPATSRPAPSSGLQGPTEGLGQEPVGLLRADANPSQVWRLPAQHQPTLAAPVLVLPSRPVPPLIQIAGVRASSPTAVALREAMVMKQWLRSRSFGSCSSQLMPSLTVKGVRPSLRMAGRASLGSSYACRLRGRCRPARLPDA